MDVERIQKINNLAVDLMRRGLAENREDAVAQAEKIYEGKDSEEYNSIRQQLGEMKEETQPAEEKKEIPAAEEPELPAEKVKEILEQNTKFLVKTIRDFTEKMEVLHKEVADLRTKITYQRLPTVKDVVEQKGQEQPSTPPKEENNGSHPRSGNYNDQDVSIEKYFYMGSK